MKAETETFEKIKTPQKSESSIPPLGGVGGAVAVMEALVAENVETTFGYPGGAIMLIYDALYDYNEKLKHIQVRHEHGAIHAAQGYAELRPNAGRYLLPA